MASMRDVLTEWIQKDVTIVNPQSFAETLLKDVVRLETYKARVSEIGDDFLRLTFKAPKKNRPASVDQVIPFHEVKRVSVWGEERIIHL